MFIKINRDSVCLGDDMNDHSTTYLIDEDTRFSDIFSNLIEQNFFPKVSQNNVVWTLTCDNNDIVSWTTYDNQMHSCIPLNDGLQSEASPLNIQYFMNIKEIHFKYYSSPLKRAEYLFKKYKGNKMLMQYEGYIHEYLAYHIDKQTEENWKNTQ
ncbi:MAG: hypothetical protein LUG46_08620 [Erysipelotrichaceae bacterium]|nr:hypothetical protein [Erysipelotrichaceae bacterium]